MENSDFNVIVDSLMKRIEELCDNIAQKIYTTTDLCEYLHIAPKTLVRMRANGEINYFKVGKKYLYTQSDIDDFINRNKYVFN